MSEGRIIHRKKENKSDMFAHAINLTCYNKNGLDMNNTCFINFHKMAQHNSIELALTLHVIDVVINSTS